ncbi:MAG: hypothetical protein ACRBFS_11285 [Aureispira sp.]
MKIRFSPDSISRDELAKLKKVQPQELATNAVEKHLFKYKQYKKQLEKDLIKAKKFMAEDPEASIEFYLCIDYGYTDKDKMPLLVVGKPAGQWKKFLKERILQHKTTDAVGFVRFDDSKKDETGLGYLELTIEKGKPKQKMIKKLVDKWLMPSGLEISFGGDSDLGDEAAPPVDQINDNPVELDANDQVQALFLAWQAGKFTGKEEQKKRLKIKAYLDKWQDKYEALSPEQQAKVKVRKAQHDYMLDELDKYEAPEDGETQGPGVTGIVLEGGDGKTTLSRINIAGFGLDAPSKMDKFKKTNYSKTYAALESFNAETDLARKRKLFDGVMSMIEKWVAHHKKDKVSTDKTKKQLQGLEKIFEKYKTFMTSYEGVKLEGENKSTHQDTESLTGTKTLFDETAGNKKSSEQAKDVRDASVDDRALRLAQLLKRGKASNDDKTFGAVMKWLADNVYEELEGKYVAATEQAFKKKSTLVSDVISVFEVGSLRTLYLLDKLKGEESEYAKLAFALGLMGKTWVLEVVSLGQKDTVEREDAMDIIIKGYPAATIQKILDSDASKTTFEGAIANYLRKEHPNMRRQIEAHMGLQQARESKNPEDIKEANDAYLTSMIHRLRKEGTFGKRLDKDTLLKEITRWLENASDQERKDMLDARSGFMKELTGMAGTFSFSGIDKGDLAFIKEKLKAKQDLPENKKTNAVFDHLKALAEQQHTKSFVSRWIQDKSIGNQFQEILFSQDMKDPQKAAVAKFCTDEQFQQWENIEKELAEELQKEEDQQDTVKIQKLNDKREEIFETAYSGIQGLMDRAQVNHDIQKEISETLRSNGAKGAVYQELVAMAKGRMPVVNFGKDIRLVLAKLEPGDKQLAAIKADEELLKILQARTLGRMGLEGNQKQWNVIAKKLGLKPPLSNLTLTDNELEEQGDIDNFKREHRVNRGKLQNKEELAQQAKEVAQQKESPGYWAARIVTSYKSSRLTTDEHVLLQLMFEAQKKGVNINDILKELEGLSRSTYNYLMTDDNYACRTIQEAANNGNRPITAREMLTDSRESVVLKRRVKSSEVDKLIDLMSPEELLKDAFDFKALEDSITKKKDLLEKLKNPANEEVREKQEKELEDLNRRIKRFDISPEFMEKIDDVLPPQKAITVKATMRTKVGEALIADGDNPTKDLIKKLGGFTDADIKLIGTDIKAISAIELEKQSETGLQWSSLSSRMLQRDVATADFLTKGWERNERIPAMGGVLNEKDLEEEKETLVKGLVNAESQLAEAREKFEARKKMYDARLAQAVNALMQAVFFTLTMASGVGAAAGVVQLLWALGSTFIQTSISETIRMVTSGDRSGGAVEKASDFFFTALADQAGAVTGLIGANLAFALDVKALGIMSQGTGPDGKPLLSNWENILRTPFLKTANGVLKGTFADIGKNFVDNLANEKDSMLKDPIGDLATWGKKTVASLPRRYLKALIMTTAATGVGALAKELEWDFLKYHNPDAAGKNKYTANGEDRAFASDDARLGFFNSDADNFEEWYNGWGMFDASPTFGGAGWNGGTDPMSGFLEVFSSAAKNLQDPKVLTALANSVVWGSMDGSKYGIKQQLGSLVDKSLDSFTVYSGQPIDDATRAKLKEQMETSLEESIDKQQQELLDALEAGYGKNLKDEQVEKLQAGEYNPQEVMVLWNQFDWIGDGQNPENNLEFFNKVAGVLSLSEEQIKLYRREEVCHEFTTVDEFVLHYNKSKEDYDRVLNDKVFVDTYIEQRSNDGTHPIEIEYTINFDGEDLVNVKEVESDLNVIYAEWKKLKEMEAQEMSLNF